MYVIISNTFAVDVREVRVYDERVPRGFSDEEDAMEKAECVVGGKVQFGRERGEQTVGEIVKVNGKRCKVRTLTSRGKNGRSAVGSVWTVPFSLLTPFTGTVPEVKTDDPAAIIAQIKVLAARLPDIYRDELAMELGSH